MEPRPSPRSLPPAAPPHPPLLPLTVPRPSPPTALVYETPAAGVTDNVAPAASPVSARWARQVIRRFENRGVGVGFLAAFVTLLFVNLPLLNVEGEWVFWWKMIGAPGSTRPVILCAVVVLSAAAAGAAAVKLRGVKRGAVFLGAAAAGGVVLTLAAAGSGEPGAALLFYAAWVLVPALALALAAAAEFRALAPWAAIGRAITGGLGLLTLAATVLVAGAILRESGLTSGSARGAGTALKHLPVTVLASLWLGVIGYAACLAAGVLGVAGAIRRHSRRLTIATAATAVSAAALVAAAVVCMACGVGELIHAAGAEGMPLPVSAGPGRYAAIIVPGSALVLILLRAICVAYAFVALAAAGLGEVLLGQTVAPLAPAGHTKPRHDDPTPAPAASGPAEEFQIIDDVADAGGEE